MSKLNYKVLLIFLVLFSCKKVVKEESKNDDKLVLNNNIVAETNYNSSSCLVSSNSIKLVISEQSNQGAFIEIGDDKNINYKKKINASEDISTISLKCFEDFFCVTSAYNLGNNYSSSNYIFDLVENNSNTFFLNRIYNTESTRNGISLNLQKLSSKVDFNDFDFLKKYDSVTIPIYSFNGFQEGIEPEINDYFDLIKSTFQKKEVDKLKDLTQLIVLEFVSENVEMNKNNISKFNDIAFYIEQSKLYEEAIFILEKIIKEFPDRTVAYINLGDAYWGLGDKSKAKEAYTIYISQMKEKNKESKIPKIVFERLSN